MTAADKLVSVRAGIAEEASFEGSVCLSFLRSAQNEDGGWGFHPGSQSRVEPTCWVLLALAETAWLETEREILERGFRFLRAAQLQDGSWPSAPSQDEGCWVTSLACWALLYEGNSQKVLAAGLNWLCEDWPRDSGLWQRLLRRSSSDRHLSSQNDSYRGWGWTPRTSSWVEPTSLALIVLSQSPKELLPPAAAQRRKLAVAMLYDRMCPGGGWNCGNPLVYGVPGDPLVIPTVWALLALRDNPDRPENAMSLNWLERNWANIQGPGSLALARICLEMYGRSCPTNGRRTRKSGRENELLKSVPVAAWMSLAESPWRNLLSLDSWEIT